MSKKDLAHTLTPFEITNCDHSEAKEILKKLKDKKRQTKLVLIKKDPPTWKEIPIN